MTPCERCGKDTKSYRGLCEDCWVDVRVTDGLLLSSQAAYDMATRTRGQYRSVGAGAEGVDRVPLFRAGVESNKHAIR